ncbi:3'-5' exonuclease [Vibrio maerlii]|uniref:3'-5' exonuclease n=1 Tax=Vibrio maerlii TaxID=2231648 RepID=UPI000E3EBE06|nr:3'-5' exonuclease [Vibrio maerlii]
MIRYFHPLLKFLRGREQYLQSTSAPKMLKDLITDINPTIETVANELEYIVVDLETTGLDSERDIILSIGWVTVSGERIDLAGAHHIYIDDSSQINPETAVINHITPQMLEDGVPIHDAMSSFLEAARGKVLVAHACVVESQFFRQYLALNYSAPEFPLLWVDTMCIEKKLAQALNQADEIDVSLWATRHRYGLPEYHGHNALTDAVATAELLLAQSKRINGSKTNFGQLFKLSH